MTTTESIGVSSVRCGVCGKLARGGVLLNDRGECCVREGDRALLESMIEDAPAPVEHKTFIGHDPFAALSVRGRLVGYHPSADRVIAFLRQAFRISRKPGGEWLRKQSPDGWMQATPENVELVETLLVGKLGWKHAGQVERVIPPPSYPGEPLPDEFEGEPILAVDPDAPRSERFYMVHPPVEGEGAKPLVNRRKPQPRD